MQAPPVAVGTPAALWPSGSGSASLDGLRAAGELALVLREDGLEALALLLEIGFLAFGKRA